MTDAEILDYLDKNLAQFFERFPDVVGDMNIGTVVFTVGPGRPKGTARELLSAAVEKRAALVVNKLTNG